MIEPEWLEQTFIMTNRADSPGTHSDIDSVRLEFDSLDIKAEKYRSFVNKKQNPISYFQPILDRLQVIPDKFNIERDSVILEGKSDYYIMRYAANLVAEEDLYFLPGFGAGTLGALVALATGWNLNYLFILDSDKTGKREQKKYVREFAIPETTITTLMDHIDKVSEIEDLKDDAAALVIQEKLGLDNPPSKNQIMRFFQEMLATNQIVPLGSRFEDRFKKLFQSIRDRLERTGAG